MPHTQKKKEYCQAQYKACWDSYGPPSNLQHILHFPRKCISL